MGFWRKKKPEKEKGNGPPLRGEPDYESLRIVPGYYIERDPRIIIDNINKAGGISNWMKGKRAEASNQLPEASDKTHRSSEDPA